MPVRAPVLTAEFRKVIQDAVDAYQITWPVTYGRYKGFGIKIRICSRDSPHARVFVLVSWMLIGSCSQKASLSASLGRLVGDFAPRCNVTPLPTTGLSALSWKTTLSDILSGDWESPDLWASQRQVPLMRGGGGGGGRPKVRRLIRINGHDLSCKRTSSEISGFGVLHMNFATTFYITIRFVHSSLSLTFVAPPAKGRGRKLQDFHGRRTSRHGIIRRTLHQLRQGSYFHAVKYSANSVFSSMELFDPAQVSEVRHGRLDGEYLSTDVGTAPNV
jgi:hypothetical protein